MVHNYQAFDDQALGFGGGFSQSASGVFDLHDDVSNIERVKMFLQIDCPNGNSGCDDWARFANIKVKDNYSGNWFEIGRYITPYWTGTQVLERGLEFDVTDFKFLLTGATELRIYIENWTAKPDIISIDFDYVVGTPDYQNYEVSEVLSLHSNSIDCVPYGVAHNIDLEKSVLIPAAAESAGVRPRRCPARGSPCRAPSRIRASSGPASASAGHRRGPPTCRRSRADAGPDSGAARDPRHRCGVPPGVRPDARCRR